jgi:hypothetical protein
LPIYFQAIDGATPSESGIRVLPLILATTICTLVGAAGVGKLGYFQPFLIIGSAIVTVGSGLIYTLDINSPSSKYIGYQIAAGIGGGLPIQVPVIVAQAISARVDVSVTMSTIMCKFLLYIQSTDSVI